MDDDNQFHEPLFAVAVVDFAAPGASQKLTDSLKTTGFAVLTNTPVPNDLIQDVYDEWREFMIRLHHDHRRNQHETPNSNPNLAQKYYLDLERQDGYFPTAVSETAKGATARDLKHYYQLYFPHGRYPDEVSDKAHQLWQALFDLGQTLVGWIDAHMPADTQRHIQQTIGQGVTLSECLSHQRTMMRILHYPGQLEQPEPGAVRAAAHEDINLITVLPAGSARGLQVKSNQSGTWHEVPLVKGSIVINVGDMLQEMSNHAYISTTHRVIRMTSSDTGNDSNVSSSGDSQGGTFGSGDRMSTPCFIHLKKKCPLSSRYGSADHYLKERLVTLGVVPPTVLDEFLEDFPKGVVPGWDPSEE